MMKANVSAALLFVIVPILMPGSMSGQMNLRVSGGATSVSAQLDKGTLVSSAGTISPVFGGAFVIGGGGHLLELGISADIASVKGTASDSRNVSGQLVTWGFEIAIYPINNQFSIGGTIGSTYISYGSIPLKATGQGLQPEVAYHFPLRESDESTKTKSKGSRIDFSVHAGYRMSKFPASSGGVDIDWGGAYIKAGFGIGLWNSDKEP